MMVVGAVHAGPTGLLRLVVLLMTRLVGMMVHWLLRHPDRHLMEGLVMVLGSGGKHRDLAGHLARRHWTHGWYLTHGHNGGVLKLLTVEALLLLLLLHHMLLLLLLL